MCHKYAFDQAPCFRIYSKLLKQGLLKQYRGPKWVNIKLCEKKPFILTRYMQLKTVNVLYLTCAVFGGN